MIIKHFGGVGATARVLGISKQAVSKWPDPIPLGRQYQIEVLTEGKMRAERRTRREQAA